MTRWLRIPVQGRAVAGAAEFGQISPENFSDLRLQYGQLRLRENSLFCRTKCGIKACCGDWWLLAHSWSLRGKVLSDVFKCYTVTHCGQFKLCQLSFIVPCRVSWLGVVSRSWSGGSTLAINYEYVKHLAPGPRLNNCNDLINRANKTHNGLM